MDSRLWSVIILLIALKKLNVPEARLRWPNDLMSGRKKLAGLLIEQGGRQKLTVGIGMNVLNAPWDLTVRHWRTAHSAGRHLGRGSDPRRAYGHLP